MIAHNIKKFFDAQKDITIKRKKVIRVNKCNWIEIITDIDCFSFIEIIHKLEFISAKLTTTIMETGKIIFLIILKYII